MNEWISGSPELAPVWLASRGQHASLRAARCPFRRSRSCMAIVPPARDSSVRQVLPLSVDWRLSNLSRDSLETAFLVRKEEEWRGSRFPAVTGETMAVTWDKYVWLEHDTLDAAVARHPRSPGGCTGNTVVGELSLFPPPSSERNRSSS